jgi:Holliday junction resolvase YEN1
VRVSSVPEFLAKQLLKHFGFPLHYAPGEAEAECALLQREGIVDAVLSEDVDTLMFGSAMTLRSWTPEQKSSKTPTHVNVYEAHATKSSSGLDRNGMILVAMMSGGDYITEGIPGCGPKLACEAARAGFGDELCSLDRKDSEALSRWRDKLRHQIRTNESNHFRQKRPRLDIPDSFPDQKVLGYYTHPCISGPDKIAKLRDTLKWDMPLDYPSLRDFAGDAFDWRCIGGAKKFIRNLAPAVLVRELRMRGEAVGANTHHLSVQEAAENSLVNAIHGKRMHPTTDNTPELRISFKPIDLVDIDLSIEDPDEELPEDQENSDSEPLSIEDGECPSSPKKKRGPSTYDPSVHEKVWLLDTFVRLGAPLKVQDWEASAGAPKQKSVARPRKAAAAKGSGAHKPAAEKTASGMQKGALDRFTKTRKPGVARPTPAKSKSPEFDEIDLSSIDVLAQGSLNEVPRSNVFKTRLQMPELDLRGDSSSDTPLIPEMDLSNDVTNPLKRSSKRPSPEQPSPVRRARPRIVSPLRSTSRPPEIINLLSSPVKAVPLQRAVVPPPNMRDHFKQFSKPVTASLHDDDDPALSLPETVTRRRRSPLKRHQTAPNAGTDDMDSPTLRPTTPRGLDIEAIDLASPESLPSLPRFGFLRKVSQETRQAVDMTSLQTPSLKALKTKGIPPTVGTGVSSEQKEANVVDVSSSMPPPPSESRLPANRPVHDRPTISVSALLPVNKKLRDRKHKVATVVSTTSTTNSSATPSLDLSETVQAQEARVVQAVSLVTVETPLRKAPKKTTKRFIQPRESLPGAWKIIEMDLSAPTPKDRRLYRKSGVEELDLTGE